jgi:hypothetical protein
MNEADDLHGIGRDVINQDVVGVDILSAAMNASCGMLTLPAPLGQSPD